MGNPLFAYPDRTLAATLSGGSWSAALPLANLRTPLLSRVARSADADPASTQWIQDLGSERSIRVMALCRHNASVDATARWRFYADAALTQLVHDTGNRPFWPAYWPTEMMEWEQPNFWGGEPTEDDLAMWPTPDLWHALPQPIWCRYVRVEIVDPHNPAGYFEVGRSIVAPAVEAVMGGLVEASAGWQSRTRAEQSLQGVDFFDARAGSRVVTGTLEHLSTAEGMAMVWERQRRLDIHGELYFVWNPDDELLLYRQRSMLCRHTDLDPLDFPYFDRTRHSFALKEVL